MLFGNGRFGLFTTDTPRPCEGAAGMAGISMNGQESKAAAKSTARAFVITTTRYPTSASSATNKSGVLTFGNSDPNADIFGLYILPKHGAIRLVIGGHVSPNLTAL